MIHLAVLACENAAASSLLKRRLNLFGTCSRAPSNCASIAIALARLSQLGLRGRKIIDVAATQPTLLFWKLTGKPDADPKIPLREGFLRSFFRWVVIGTTLVWLLAALILVAARWIDPPTTAVHVQRRLQAWINHTPYHKRYKFIPLSQISPDLQHAVVAAEDARFYQHHGFDWHEVQIAAEDDLEGGRTRGASTITQQLVKNLFFGTGRSVVRKAAEFTLVPVAEFVLGKRRILEIYLNVVEWGPGIYGAESACRYYDGTMTRNVGREQAARLAAILPAPLKRRPERMNKYSALILDRMRTMGW